MAEKKCSLAPLKVSPLIKLTRWVCLIAGVIYGFKKRRMYAAIEAARREKEEAERPAKEAYLREEKLRRDTAELKELEEIFLGTSETEVFIEG